MKRSIPSDSVRPGDVLYTNDEWYLEPNAEIELNYIRAQGGYLHRVLIQRDATVLLLGIKKNKPYELCVLVNGHIGYLGHNMVKDF